MLQKIKNNIKYKVGSSYLFNILFSEYKSQKYITYNERPVEYSFVFRQLATHCPSTILDVGTGVTALPHLMRSCGFKVTAIDNVKDYWPKGMINRHFFVVDDDITNSKLTERFDFITCVSTLEHIVQYEKAIETMSALLNPKGKISISFPYNENEYCPNVYDLPGSGVQHKFPFVTQAFSRKNINHWCEKYNLQLLEQEYWAFFTGEYWSTGERLKFPEKSSQRERHQISCLVFEKV